MSHVHHSHCSYLGLMLEICRPWKIYFKIRMNPCSLIPMLKERLCESIFWNVWVGSFPCTGHTGWLNGLILDRRLRQRSPSPSSNLLFIIPVQSLRLEDFVPRTKQNTEAILTVTQHFIKPFDIFFFNMLPVCIYSKYFTDYNISLYQNPIVL